MDVALWKYARNPSERLMLCCMVRIAQAQLAEVVEDTGFEGRVLGKGAASDAAQLRVDGMTCGACSSAVEKALRAAPGVLSASVNLIAGTAEVRGTTAPYHTVVFLASRITRGTAQHCP